MAIALTFIIIVALASVCVPLGRRLGMRSVERETGATGPWHGPQIAALGVAWIVVVAVWAIWDSGDFAVLTAAVAVLTVVQLAFLWRLTRKSTRL